MLRAPRFFLPCVLVVGCAPAHPPTPVPAPVEPFVLPILPGGIVASPPEECGGGSVIQLSGPGSRRVVDDPKGKRNACAWVPEETGRCPEIDVEAAAGFVDRHPGQHVWTVRLREDSRETPCEGTVFAHATRWGEVEPVAQLLAAFYQEAGVGGGFDIFVADQTAVEGLCSDAPRGTASRQFPLRDGEALAKEGVGTLAVRVEAGRRCGEGLVFLSTEGERAVVSGMGGAETCMEAVEVEAGVTSGACQKVHFQAVYAAVRDALAPRGVRLRVGGVPCEGAWLPYLEVGDVRQVELLAREVGEVLERWDVAGAVGIRAAGEGCVKLL